MSFDIFVIKFENAEVTTFRRSIFEEIFGPYVARRERDFMQLEYPDRGGADVYIDDGDDISGMMFNHCGGDGFWQDVYELMKRTQSAIFWPALGPSCVVPDKVTLVHLSADFLESVGKPTIANSGVEIAETISRS